MLPKNFTKHFMSPKKNMLFFYVNYSFYGCRNSCKRYKVLANNIFYIFFWEK
jgi:hypothetical protein